MAILSNVNGKFAVDSTGAIQFSGSAGTSGYILRSNGNAAPTWVDSSTVIGGPYLPLTGGTLSGALAGTSATFSGTVTGQANSNTFGTASASGRALIVQAGSSNQAIRLQNNLGGDGTISATGTATTMNYSFGTYSVAPALFIQNDGNVGIGAATPSSKLHVDSGTAHGEIRLTTSTAAGYDSILSLIAGTSGGVSILNLGYNGDDDYSRIFRTGSGDLRFDTNNAEKMRITGGGDVVIGGGIGNGSRFNIIGTTNTSVGYNQMNIANASAAWGLLLGYGNGLLTTGYHGLNHAAIINVQSAPLHLGTSNLARLTILANGNVGIGTDTPGKKLVVYGDIGFGAGDYNGGVYVNDTVTSADANWGLEVQRTANVDDYNTRLKYYPVSGHSRAAGIYDSRNTRFSLYSDTNNNPNIIIPHGNVGIKTQTPYSSLSVIDSNSFGYFSSTSAYRTATFQGSGSTSIVVAANGNSNGIYSEIRLGNTQATYANYSPYVRATQGNGIDSYSLEFGTSSGGVASTKMYIGGASGTTLGNVGIGTTSPTAKLTVQNDDGVSNGLHVIGDFNRSAGTDAQLILGYYANGSSVTGPVLYAANSKPLLFAAGGTEKMRITSAGNVLIGTTNNAGTLNVGGKIFAAQNNSNTAAMRITRTVSIPHGSNAGNFTFDFDPVAIWGFSVTGGHVEINVAGWSQRLNAGFIQFQNNGGGAPLTIAIFVQTAVNGNGTISVQVPNPGVSNTIRITFANWHSNAHAWNAWISSPKS